MTNLAPEEKKTKRKMGPATGLRKKKYVHKEHNKAFPGDFKNFTESKEFKKSKADALSTMKSAKQHPVEREDAGLKFLKQSGPNEQKAFKKYRERTANTRDTAKTFKVGGRVGLKDGSKGCGKAKAGKGKAYGKNS